jgi:predicted metal-dependent hydrolase
MPEPHDPRYLEGIELFNRGEYFDAHEVWEDLWQDCPACERRFYQALIQAAVAIYHFERGNFSGTARLARSGKRYMESFRPSYRGLDIDVFWQLVEAYVAGALGRGEATPQTPRPMIVLDSASAPTRSRAFTSQPPLPQGEGE